MTTPTTAEVGHGSRQEEIVSCIGSPRRAVFMRFKQLAIVTVLVGGAAIGTVASTTPPQPSRRLAMISMICGEHFDTRPPSTMTPIVWSGTDGVQATCFEEDAGTTRLGMVFVNPSRIDGVIDPARPEILYYEPQSDGDLKLMGGEYFCPIEACPTPPTLFNQTFRFEEDTHGHALHVWAWLSNPTGLTNPANPNVDTTYCP